MSKSKRNKNTEKKMSEKNKETLKEDFNITTSEFLEYKKLIHSNINSILDYELKSVKGGFSIINTYYNSEDGARPHKVIKNKLALIEEKLTKIKDATINLGR
jgi:hypothetical protein|tara:strand:- start:5023 stop:5328 length:306 start_codon:yes stop_codon:yes gene_type:complete